MHTHTLFAVKRKSRLKISFNGQETQERGNRGGGGSKRERERERENFILQGL